MFDENDFFGTEQSTTEQNTTEQNTTEQSTTEQNTTEQNTTEQNLPQQDMYGLFSEEKLEVVIDQPVTKKKKKGSKWWKILLAVLGVLVVIVVAIAMIILSNPIVKLTLALDKTFFKSETISFDAEFGEYDDPEIQIKGEIKFGDDAYDSEFSINYTEGRYTDRLTLNDGALNLDGDRLELEECFEDVDDMLYDEGLSLNVADILDRVINNKLDRDELVNVFINEIIPEFNEYSNHDFQVDTSSIDFETFCNDFLTYLEEEDIDVFELERAKSQSKNGTTYRYEIDVSEFVEALYEYALERDEFHDFLDDYTQEYWDKRGSKYYINAGYGQYASPKDMKTKLLWMLEDFVEDVGEDDITIDGIYVIDSGRLTYFEIEVDNVYGKIEIDSAS